MITTKRGTFSTPLRYPGGKGRITPFVKELFEINGLCDGHYVEPYAGGAGIAVTLLLQEYASCIHINDLNQSVYAFWSTVLANTDELCRLINDTPVTADEWRRQKEVHQNPAQHSSLQLGFSTFFLNRTNRSGIIDGGMIGGKNQTGKWKLDARYNKKDLVLRIQKIARLRARIRLYQMDAGEFIENVLPRLPNETLIYLDPPYYVKGEGLYQHFYQHEDHVRIARLVREKIRQPWMVSYDNHQEIRALYSGYRTHTYSLQYSAQDRYAGSEVMVFSRQLRLPPGGDLEG